MATAPAPGVGRRIALSEELKQAEKSWLRIVCDRDGKDVTLHEASIGPEDEQMAAAQSGVDLWAALADPTSVTRFSVAYWTARRKNGERNLTFRDVVKTFPDVQALIDAGVDMYRPDEDDEEGSDDVEPQGPTGPGSPSETTGPN